MKPMIYRTAALLLMVNIVTQSYDAYIPQHNLFHAQSFDNHAIAWIQTYVFDRYHNKIVQDADLNYVANLMYFSFRRSQETIRAQETALSTLKGQWHGWQNIAKRRLNPSHKPPYSLDIAHEVKKNEDFWRQYALHQRMSDIYDHTVSQVVYGNLLSSPTIAQGVKDMRIEARKIMLEALADIKQHLGTIFDYALSKKQSSHTDIIRNISDFVLSYIPQLAVNTFIHADALHNKVSEETWNTLYTTQEIGTYTWYAIEKARMAFYRAHYTHLYLLMKRLNLKPSYFNISFTENGFTLTNIPLPDPNTL